MLSVTELTGAKERRHTKGKSIKGKKYRERLQKKAESTVHTTEIDIESGNASKDHCKEEARSHLSVGKTFFNVLLFMRLALLTMTYCKSSCYSPRNSLPLSNVF